MANRVRTLKKKFELQVTCTHGSTNANNGSATSTPVKGAKAARGPIKAKAEPTGDETEEEKPATPKTAKRGGRKPGPKSKKAKAAAAASTEDAEAEPAAAKEDGENEDEA